MEQININVNKGDIEVCHRCLKSTKNNLTPKVILQFVNRKHGLKALKKKKELKDIDAKRCFKVNTLGLYSSESLCPTYHEIYDNAHQLLKSKVIKHL